MASDPIISCGHRTYPVRLVYPALFDGLNRISCRIRLCNPCFDDYWGTVLSNSGDGNDCSSWFRQRPGACDWQDGQCGIDANGSVLFVTAYPDGKTRTDRVARLCGAHEATVRQSLIWGL